LNLIERGGRALLLCAALWSCAALTGCSTWECNAETCSDGCCDSSGTCKVGSPDDTCGLNGAACRDCTASPGQFCSAGTCAPKCTPANCPDGCCTEDGHCSEGNSSFACGLGGTACVDCMDAGRNGCAAGSCCSRFSGGCATDADCCDAGATEPRDRTFCASNKCELCYLERCATTADCCSGFTCNMGFCQ
jgi:hypothetical protein